MEKVSDYFGGMVFDRQDCKDRRTGNCDTRASYGGGYRFMAVSCIWGFAFWNAVES